MVAMQMLGEATVSFKARSQVQPDQKNDRPRAAREGGVKVTPGVSASQFQPQDDRPVPLPVSCQPQEAAAKQPKAPTKRWLVLR